MKRLRSIRGKIQTEFGNSSLWKSVHNKPPIRVLLASAIDSHSNGPSSTQLNTIAKYTLISHYECNEVYNCLADYLKRASLRRSLDNIQVTKLSKIIKYIFAAGNEQFYESFSRGDCIWILKSIRETALYGTEGRVEILRNEIQSVLEMCENPKKWQIYREENKAIHQEIHSPTSRHSFDGGIPMYGSDLVEGRHGLANERSKRRSSWLGVISE